MADHEWVEDPRDNSTIGASGMAYWPDERTEAEKSKDAKRFRRRVRRQVWMWRLRGLLPRGWKDPEDY